MQKRSLCLLVAILFAFSGIMMRLMQLVREPLAETSGTRSTVTVTVAQLRGTIYDRNLSRLTNQTETYAASVIAAPEAMAALSTALPSAEWETLARRLQDGKPITLQSETPLPLTTGIRQFTVAMRYAEKQPAAHVIGYLGDDGMSGACGIEKAFDEELKRASGSVTVSYQTDGHSNALQGGEVQVSNTLFRANAGVALTLDSEIQSLTETIVSAKITKGAAVILDPSNGDILAMASFPNFSPNRLAEYLDREDAPLYNRAMASYNCGSVFKTVSTITALESGVPTTQTFTCNGSLKVGQNRIKCHHVLGHGTVDMMEGFGNSCNPYYIQLMQLTGGLPLYRTACLLGFDRPLVLADGYVTARATLPSEETFMMETALANLSFGQGDLLATPLHVAQMTACIVNGGKAYAPNLYKGSVDTVGNLTPANTNPPVQVCSATTANAVKNMMQYVVENGTGQAAAPRVGGAGGKTGTAQTGWVGEDGETMVQNWFTGFYPLDEPQYVITLLAEDSKRTGESTAPVFAELCDALYRAGYVK